MIYYLLLLGLSFGILYYLIRSMRILGSKLTVIQRENRESFKKLNASIERHRLKTQNNLNLTVLPALAAKPWNFTISITSHEARFGALEQMLPTLKHQVIQPTRVIVVIAENEIEKLPASIKALQAQGDIEIRTSHDLGPGKKLIPLLATQNEPIIVLDDDLILAPDLTLQLMVQHHLYPDAIIASRTHQVTRNDDGSLKPFSEWSKQSTSEDGPSANLLPTSGAGTLFPVGSLHEDATVDSLYRNLAFHTDDLWWYAQARRKGTLVRRVPGERVLEFIPDSQEVGLWSTGNKDRNDENLAKLVEKYGDIFR